MQPLILIVSKERTASQAVYSTLREAMHSGVVHSHYLDAGHIEDRPNLHARKLAKLDFVAHVIDRAPHRTYVTIVRDLTDRMLSGLWYLKHEDLIAWRNERGSFAGAEEVIEKKLQINLLRDAEYHRHVYSRIGLPENPAPGRYELGEDQAYVLDFANLAEDFGAMSESLAGRRLELGRRNSGETIGGALYPEFRSWAEPFVRANLP